MAYPSNQACWDLAAHIKPPPPGAILVFAYAAKAGHLPGDNGEGLAPFNAFMHDLFGIAGGTGIDGCLIAGYVQQAGDFPTLPKLEQYLNTIGVRDPATKQLIHPHYCPGPGDGYLGNRAGTTDPGLGTAAPGANVPAPAPAPPPVPAPAPPAGAAAPAPGPAGPAAPATPPSLSGVVDWAKANPIAAAGIGVGLVLLLGRR